MPSSKAWSLRPLEDAAREASEGDPGEICQDIFSLIDEHEVWHDRALNLVAAHNIMSPKAKAVLSSGLADKIQSHSIGHRPHGGGGWIDRLETLTVELAKRLFRVRYVEYRAMSGALANALAFFGLVEPNQRVLAVSRRHGADATTRERSVGGRLGLQYLDIPYHENGIDIDIEAVAQQIHEFKPHWLIVGSATLRFPVPVQELTKLAEAAGARVSYDGAHILGLMAGGQFQDPLAEGAAVLTGSTQKTLPGPIGGLILSNDQEVGERVIQATTELISNYHNNRVAALAVTLAEMLQFGKEYTRDMVQNAQTLAQALDEEGFTVPDRERGYTMSHIVIVDLGELMDSSDALGLLEAAGIACSGSVLPASYPQRRGIRFGTPAVTRLGMGSPEMREAARLIRRVLIDREGPARIAQDVAQLASGFQTVRYCF